MLDFKSKYIGETNLIEEQYLDFRMLQKEAFLESYSYISEDEYNKIAHIHNKSEKVSIKYSRKKGLLFIAIFTKGLGVGESLDSCSICGAINSNIVVVKKYGFTMKYKGNQFRGTYTITDDFINNRVKDRVKFEDKNISEELEDFFFINGFDAQILLSDNEEDILLKEDSK